MENKQKEDEFLAKKNLFKSSVYLSSPKLLFQPHGWMPISDFVNLDKSRKLSKSFPNGSSEDGELTYTGKTRSILSRTNRITDQIGTVKRSSRKMEIAHTNKVHDIQLFMVLGFKDMDSVYWKPVSLSVKDEIPTHALRIGVDVLTQDIIYIGRCKQRDLVFTGPYMKLKKQLVTACNAKVTTFTNFEILCLKPTPASLKHLTRLQIRHLTKNENLAMNQLEYRVDPFLMSYIQIRQSLKTNESLRRGECIISRSGLYKLAIEPDGRLLYYFSQERDFLFLYENVESLWFNDIKIMVCFQDGASRVFLTGEDNLNIMLDEAKLKIDDDGTLKLITSNPESNLVFQFRDDIESSWNLSRPGFDFVYFFEPKKSDQSSDSESDSDSDDSDSNSDSDTD